MPILLLKVQILMTKALYEHFAEMPCFARDFWPKKCQAQGLEQGSREQACQQFTYGVVREGAIAEIFLQHFHKLSAEFPHPSLMQ